MVFSVVNGDETNEGEEGGETDEKEEDEDEPEDEEDEKVKAPNLIDEKERGEAAGKEKQEEELTTLPQAATPSSRSDGEEEEIQEWLEDDEVAVGNLDADTSLKLLSPVVLSSR